MPAFGAVGSFHAFATMMWLVWFFRPNHPFRSDSRLFFLGFPNTTNVACSCHDQPPSGDSRTKRWLSVPQTSPLSFIAKGCWLSVWRTCMCGSRAAEWLQPEEEVPNASKCSLLLTSLLSGLKRPASSTKDDHAFPCPDTYLLQCGTGITVRTRTA
jgi:hypothetical protein